MPIINTQTDSGANVNYAFTTGTTNLYITQSAAIISSQNFGINMGAFSTNTVYNNGYVAGSIGITAGGPSATITNSATGAIYGYSNAIRLEAVYGVVQNAGSISSQNDAILVLGNSALISNSGTIASYNGISLRGVNGVIVNDGIINVQNCGVVATSGASGSVIINNGHISATIAIFSPAINTTVHNNGEIVGNVVLATGANVIDGVGGSITGNIDGGTGADRFDLSHMTVSGIVSGGAGNDVIIGTVHDDMIYGDSLGSSTGGADTLFGGYGDDTVFGGYGADLIYGNQGDDVLYGNQDNDWMHGGQGNDTLYGGQGDDMLNGGIGDDILVGGLGNDIFRYDAGFGRDALSDFGILAGNNDVISFGAGTFNTYADVASHMVQVGSNVVITFDANDYITIANTTTAALTADHFIFG